MSRRLAFALGAMALGWLAGPAQAAEPIYQLKPGQVVTVPVLADEAKPKAEPAPMPKDTTPILQGCDLCCDDDCGHGGFVAGVGFYFIQPHWESNPAFTVVRDSTTITILPLTISSSSVTRVEDFSYDYEFAPRVWLGYVSESGLGVRARWWNFDADAKSAIANADDTGATVVTSAAPLGLGVVSPGFILGLPGPGILFPHNPDQLVFSSDLQLDVWDLEATQEWKCGDWSILLAGGLRYAHISQSYDATRTNSTEGPLGFISFEELDSLISGHNFKGIGPSGAVEVRRYCGNSGLALYGSARGAVLFGHTKEQAGLFTSQTDRFGPIEITVESFADASVERDDVVPVVELEIGAEYGVNMGSAQLFVQAALVGQTWFGVGNAANNGTIGVPGDPTSADNNSNLGFFGLSFSAGINY